MLPWVGAAVLLGVIGALARADEFSAVITKVDAGKITFSKVKEGQKAADAATLPVADKVIVAKADFNRQTKKFSAGAALEGGLKNDMFTKIGEAGVGVRIVTDADNKKVTHILVVGPRKKKEDD